MSQNGKSTTVCPTCTKPVRGFHTLAGVLNGEAMVRCYPDGIPSEELPLAEALTFLFDTCVEKAAAETKVAELTSNKHSARQSGKATGRREAKADEASKLAETRVALREEYDVQLLDLRGQRDDLKNRFEGVSEDLVQAKNKVLELEGITERLVDAEKILKEDLDACQRTSAGLQQKVDKLTQECGALTQERDELVYKTSLIPRLENALRKRSLEYLYAGRGTVSQTIRIGRLETVVARYEKLFGPLPKEAEQTLEELLAEIEDEGPADPKDVIERAMPKPVPPPPPKAAAVIVPEPVVVQMTARVPMAVSPVAVDAVDAVDADDDQGSDPDASATADDEDDGFDRGDDDDSVIEECTFCEEHAKFEMHFISKDGTADRMTICDLATHDGAALLDHLKKTVKDAPQSVKDIPSRFNPIQQ